MAKILAGPRTIEAGSRHKETMMERDGQPGTQAGPVTVLSGPDGQRCGQRHIATAELDRPVRLNAELDVPFLG
jgi:hypothetical protein